MSDPIEFKRWYEHGEGSGKLHYMFMPFGARDGTNALVRGEPDSVVAFVYRLAKEYKSGYEAHYRGRIEQIIGKVMNTGEVGREEIFFGDDRIRAIRRLDDDATMDGPLKGSPRHVGVVHNEQYGGKYPSQNDPPINSFVDGSRAVMIHKVLTALRNGSE